MRFTCEASWGGDCVISIVASRSCEDSPELSEQTADVGLEKEGEKDHEPKDQMADGGQADHPREWLGGSMHRKDHRGNWLEFAPLSAFHCAV